MVRGDDLVWIQVKDLPWVDGNPEAIEEDEGLRSITDWTLDSKDGVTDWPMIEEHLVVVHEDGSWEIFACTRGETLAISSGREDTVDEAKESAKQALLEYHGV